MKEWQRVIALGAVFAGVLTVAACLAALGKRHMPQPAQLPDFASHEQIDEMKAAFYEYLTPIIERHNARILADRQRLLRLAEIMAQGKTLSRWDLRWIEKLARHYAVPWQADDPQSTVHTLSRRVDILPVSLALVQAAVESSWGQSRFAVQANNLFGIWCHKPGCGVVPQERPPGAVHEVQRFATVSDAVERYLHNLNTHDSYRDLRRLRQQLRTDNRPIVADALVDGLLLYSERREAYVDELRTMIQQYHSFREQQAE